ncbi:MAG: (Fe-S)-binding protein [Gammaproteobacteria bacterium]|nr:(Fe-S)-binding protein [Gammaproteobacteria bacterium]
MTTESDSSNHPEKVYFFGTCLIDLFYPEAGLAGMQLLKQHGVEVVFPQNQTCCGQPAWNSGYRDEARKVARQQLACFGKAYPIIVPSGSCAGMLKHHYPELFKDEAEYQEVAAFSERVFELTEFLVRVLKVKLTDQGEPIRVALHTSCSARREMGVDADHRSLLNQLGNVDMVTPERETECCGFGGTFSIKHPEISTAMVDDKADNILATGARQLVSGDCGCLMNISGRIEAREQQLPSQHIASFLWERTGGENE